MDSRLFLHAAATLLMTGVAWFVQVVHYPLMAAVGRADFSRFETLHRQRTAWLVAPLMVAEAGAAFWLLAAPPVGAPLWQTALGAALVAGIWISTFAVQVPLHEKLSNGVDERAHRLLVSTHALRTAAWTLRSALALWWLASC